MKNSFPIQIRQGDVFLLPVKALPAAPASRPAASAPRQAPAKAAGSGFEDMDSDVPF